MDRILSVLQAEELVYHTVIWAQQEKIQSPWNTGLILIFKHGSRGKVQKFNNSKCDTLSSESYRIVVFLV
jgi:hypothetical protein